MELEIIRRNGDVIRFSIDSEDYEKIKGIEWHCADDGKGRLSIRSSGIGILSRFLLGVTDSNVFVGFVDGNSLNCRRSNLQIMTKQQLQAKRKMQKNTSGYRGVRKRREKWIALIYVNQREVYLGTFESREDAAKAYNRAASKYFGKFARLNRIKKEI